MKAHHHQPVTARLNPYLGRSHKKKQYADIESRQSVFQKKIIKQKGRVGAVLRSKIIYTNYNHSKKPPHSGESKHNFGLITNLDLPKSNRSNKFLGSKASSFGGGLVGASSFGGNRAKRRLGTCFGEGACTIGGPTP